MSAPAPSATGTVMAYVDDAAAALPVLTAFTADGHARRWILIACPPRLSRSPSRWATRTGRAQWRRHWCERLTAALVPWLQTRGQEVSVLLADEPLPMLTQRLGQQPGLHAPIHVLDARKMSASGAEHPGQTGGRGRCYAGAS